MRYPLSIGQEITWRRLHGKVEMLREMRDGLFAYCSFALKSGLEAFWIKAEYVEPLSLPEPATPTVKCVPSALGEVQGTQAELFLKT